MPEINHLPVMLDTDIYQGTEWRGFSWRRCDEDGNPIATEGIASVVTDTLEREGTGYLDCTVESFSGEWRGLVLTEADTSSLPGGRYTIEVKVRLDADSPYATIAVLAARVHGQYTNTNPTPGP